MRLQVEDIFCYCGSTCCFLFGVLKRLSQLVQCQAAGSGESAVDKIARLVLHGWDMAAGP